MADTPNTDTKAQTDAEKAKASALQADQKAIDAQAKADDAAKSKEQLAADKAKADADRAHSEAAEAEASVVPGEPMTAAEAKVMLPVANLDEVGAGDHLAQKFGNDPANPHIAKGEHADPELCTVKLSRVTPDSAVPVVTMVHPDMVGDYLRAGWNVA